MGRCATFVAALLAPLTALEARPEAWKPPAGWTKVIEAQFTAVEMLVADDGHLSWVERKLDEATKHHRAQSFDRRLYRFAVGGTKVEQLHRTGGTKSYWPLIGPGGAVATRHDYPIQRVFLPGQPAVKLPEVLGYNPRSFVEGGLLCHAQRYSGDRGEYESSLALVPIAGGKARPDDARRLLPWHLGDLGTDAYSRYGVFRVAGRLVFTEPVYVRIVNGDKSPLKKLRPQHFVVWDEVKKEKSWEALGRPDAADGRFVYTLDGGALLRRPLAGEGRAERAEVPGLERVLALRAPLLLGLFREKGRWEVGVADLEAGTRTAFDLRVPDRGGPPPVPTFEVNGPLYLGLKDGPGRPWVPVAWDATKGRLYATDGPAIYRVPAVRRAACRPDWEPAP